MTRARLLRQQVAVSITPDKLRRLATLAEQRWQDWKAGQSIEIDSVIGDDVEVTFVLDVHKLGGKRG